MATPPDFSVGQVLTAAHMDAVGLWLIDEVSVTAAADLIVDGCFSNQFQNYRIVWSGETSSNAGVFFRFRGGTPAADRMATQYISMGLDRNGATLATFGSDVKADNLYFSNSGGSTCLASATYDIFRPFESVRTGIIWSTFFEWTSNAFFYRAGGGYYDTTDSNTGFKIYTSGGPTQTSTVRVYGYRN